jgi:hypothetical protein
MAAPPPLELWNNAKHWHDRATEMRARAENETSHFKAALLHIADNYDLIGDRAEVRLLLVPK